MRRELRVVIDDVAMKVRRVGCGNMSAVYNYAQKSPASGSNLIDDEKKRIAYRVSASAVLGAFVAS
jgi:hypothetical protein